MRVQASGSGETCGAILSMLPTWFGIEEANAAYVATAETTPATVASVGGRDVGLTLITRHFPNAAEVHLMAIAPEFHRRGIGTAMLRVAERGLAADGVRFLQVKTLSAGRVDAGYEKTRAFYRAYGFVPLEEFPSLWDLSNPALQLIKTVNPAERER